MPSINQLSIDNLKKFDVISFDFFDTLYLRAVTEPEDVFDIVASVSGEIDFKEKRREAQALAFQEMHRLKRNEISLDDIYNNYDTTVDNAITLKEIELRTECLVIKPNSELISIFNELIKLNKVVVITSDMYLNRDFFKTILDMTGQPLVELLVSSNENETKRDSGELFTILKKKYPGKKIVHIGDNYRSDVEMATEKEISAIYYTHSDLVKNRQTSGKPSLSVAQAIFRTHAADLIKKSASYDSYLTAGPAAFGFYEWIKNRAEKDDIDVVLFLSRDGYILSKIADLNDDGFKEKGAYFRGSRTAFALANINEGNFESSIPYLMSGSQNLAPREILERIGVPVASQDVMKQLGFSDEESIGSCTLNCISSLLMAFKTEIIKVCKKNRRALFNYLQKIGVKSGMNIALVDIGWRGTTQDKFEEFTNEYFDLNVLGYYFGLVDNSSNNKISMLSDLGFSQAIIEQIYHNRVIVEMFFSAPHPSVTGYKLDHDEVDFIYDEGRGVDNDNTALMNEFESGILAFFEDYKKITCSLGLKVALNELVDPILKFAIEADWRNNEYLSSVNNFDAWSSSTNLKTKPKDY
jgi:predicted HAD superfamily hydrolase